MILFGNYGDDTIALVAWCLEHREKGSSFTVVSVDTGWTHPLWSARVLEAQAYARANDLKVVRLHADPDFSESVKVRGHFPSVSFHWCALALKGLTFLKWIDEWDPEGAELIVLPRRRGRRLDRNLEEWVEAEPAFGGRRLWHPLFQHTDVEIQTLVAKTPLAWWGARSLECAPCIHSPMNERAGYPNEVHERVLNLERAIGERYFPEEPQKESSKELFGPVELYADGCQAPYVCGR